MAYTNQMIEKIEKAQPLNLAIAKELASDLGVTYRSIISKAKQMNFVYVAKAPAMKKEGSNEPTKADILSGIRSACELAEREGDLTKAELQKILQKL
jgi:CII-binding regulator of phage lambda lysogenization HflD